MQWWQRTLCLDHLPGARRRMEAWWLVFCSSLNPGALIMSCRFQRWALSCVPGFDGRYFLLLSSSHWLMIGILFSCPPQHISRSATTELFVCLRLPQKQSTGCCIFPNWNEEETTRRLAGYCALIINEYARVNQFLTFVVGVWYLSQERVFNSRGSIEKGLAPRLGGVVGGRNSHGRRSPPKNWNGRNGNSNEGAIKS